MAQPYIARLCVNLTSPSGVLSIESLQYDDVCKITWSGKVNNSEATLLDNLSHFVRTAVSEVETPIELDVSKLEMTLDDPFQEVIYMLMRGNKRIRIYVPDGMLMTWAPRFKNARSIALYERSASSLMENDATSMAF